VPIKVYYTARGDIEDGGDERKKSFLEKIPKNVDRLRMVEIQGYDINFCFGTHVRNTGEIGNLAELELKNGKRQRRIVFFKIK
jgi:misacylated tRNA(Ala) deacylase